MKDRSRGGVDRPAAHVVDEIERKPPRPFSIAARRLTDWTGSAVAACIVAVAAAVWVVAGALCGYPRGWELPVTAGLPFLTLLMLVVVQHTQNHNDKALQLKLDELIRASSGASNRMMTVEDVSHQDLDRIREDFQEQAR